MKSTRTLFIVSILVTLFGPLSTLRADTGFAGYWHGFVNYWTKFIAQRDGVTMTALLVMAVSLFIITRGKWKK
jgi:hypothetical protein